MQHNHLEYFIEGTFQQHFCKTTKENYEELEKTIQTLTPALPEGVKTPTAVELQLIDEYVNWYKQANPTASVKSIKQALCRKFNIVELPNTIIY